MCFINQHSHHWSAPSPGPGLRPAAPGPRQFGHRASVEVQALAPGRGAAGCAAAGGAAGGGSMGDGEVKKRKQMQAV